METFDDHNAIRTLFGGTGTQPFLGFTLNEEGIWITRISAADEERLTAAEKMAMYAPYSYRPEMQVVTIPCSQKDLALFLMATGYDGNLLDLESPLAKCIKELQADFNGRHGELPDQPDTKGLPPIERAKARAEWEALYQCHIVKLKAYLKSSITDTSRNILSDASQSLNAHKNAERDGYVNSIMTAIDAGVRDIAARRATERVINHRRFIDEGFVPDGMFDSVSKEVRKRIKKAYADAGFKVLSRQPKKGVTEEYFLLK